MFVTFYAKCSILRHFFYDLYDIFQIRHDLVYGHLIHDVHILRCNVNELIHCDRDKPWMRHAKHNLYHYVVRFVCMFAETTCTYTRSISDAAFTITKNYKYLLKLRSKMFACMPWI